MFTTKPESGEKITKLGGDDAKTPFTARPTTYASKSAGPNASKMVPTIIGEDLTIRGNVISTGEIQVDGEIEGDIRCGSLLLGDKAQVRGGVAAEDVVVRGHIVGSITACALRYRGNAMWKAKSCVRALPSSRVPISRENHAAPIIPSRR